MNCVECWLLANAVLFLMWILCVNIIVKEQKSLFSIVFEMEMARLLESPGEYVPAFEKALQEVAVMLYDPQKHQTDPMQESLHLGLKGNFGDLHVNPRTLRAKHIGRMVCIDGIVTRCKPAFATYIVMYFRLIGETESSTVSTLLSSYKYVSCQGVSRCHIFFR